jgi:hypothetical protein
MSTESEEGRQIVASLAQRVGNTADISHVADAIVRTLQDINAVLIPVVGPKGVAALYRRSLYVCTSTHPRLAHTYESLVVAMDLVELKSLLVRQNQADAIYFGEELLKAFYELLATLIGPSLTARLLRAVWENSSSITPAQETLP